VALPVFSSDGRWLAFHRVLEGERDIWVMPAGGGLPQKITDSPGLDIAPAWSPDDALLAFVSNRAGGNHIWVVPVTEGRPTGAPRQITKGRVQCFFPAWLADGSHIAYSGYDGEKTEVWIAPVDGRVPPRRITTGAGAQMVRRGPDDTLLVSGVWEDYPPLTLKQVWPETGKTAPVGSGIDFGNVAALGQFHLSENGRTLALIHVEARGDIWVVDAEAGAY
jgi:dipeptidyl aminopeptidase/acylaminoacyl peptidase